MLGASICRRDEKHSRRHQHAHSMFFLPQAPRWLVWLASSAQPVSPCSSVPCPLLMSHNDDWLRSGAAPSEAARKGRKPRRPIVADSNTEVANEHLLFLTAATLPNRIVRPKGSRIFGAQSVSSRAEQRTTDRNPYPKGTFRSGPSPPACCRIQMRSRIF